MVFEVLSKLTRRARVFWFRRWFGIDVVYCDDVCGDVCVGDDWY